MSRVDHDQTERWMEEVNQKAQDRKIRQDARLREGRRAAARFAQVVSEKIGHETKQTAHKHDQARNPPPRSDQRRSRDTRHPLADKLNAQLTPGAPGHPSGLLRQGRQQVEAESGRLSERDQDLSTARESEQRTTERLEQDDERSEQALMREAADGRPAENAQTPVERDPPRERPDQWAQSGSGGNNRDGQSSEHVGAAGLGRSAPITEDMLRRIVSTVEAHVSPDGRTSIQVQLSGPMLEGVRLSIRARQGQVHLKFSGCSGPLRRQIEAEQGQLARSLARKGTLSLESVAFG